MTTTSISPTPRRQSPPRGRIFLVGLLALLLAAACWFARRFAHPDLPSIPYFSIPVGKVRPPLKYRIVSFHRGRADKNLIRLASQLGFNGVQFQIEGSTLQGLQDFADRDAKEHLVDFCHSLHMDVTVWVHELSDFPDEKDKNYFGPFTVDNTRYWDALSARYDWILGQVIPNVDGLALTTVETQINATSTPVMLKLTNLIDQKCREHGKYMIARTFVWHPEELTDLMAAVKQMPAHVPIMSKIVPQDWQMRGDFAAEIGQVGDHQQIIEFDADGEYFLKDNVANPMVDQLKREMDYVLAKNADGICVRVDREDTSVIFEPQEVNLWALGMLSAGATNSPDEIWNRWAQYRYGEKAAPQVIAALKTSSDVVSEMLSVGPFTYGDTRNFPALPYEDLFDQNWQNWRWNVNYVADLAKADYGDPEFIQARRDAETKALDQADQSLAALEKAKADLSPREYQILYTKLLTNKVQLQFRSAATLAALHYRQLLWAQTQAQATAAYDQYQKDIAAAAAVADELKTYPAPTGFDYLGKTWSVNAPLDLPPDKLNQWIIDARAVPFYGNSAADR